MQQTPEQRAKMIYELVQSAGSENPNKMRENFSRIITKFLGDPLEPQKKSLHTTREVNTKFFDSQGWKAW